MKIPTNCKHCKNRKINDDWCIILASDCYKQQLLIEKVAETIVKCIKEGKDENEKDCN